MTLTHVKPALLAITGHSTVVAEHERAAFYSTLFIMLVVLLGGCAFLAFWAAFVSSFLSYPLGLIPSAWAAWWAWIHR